MALILIFAGSFTGILVAAVQMLFQNASLWQGFGTYLTFSIGFPIAAGVLALAVTTLRARAQNSDNLGLYNT